MTEARTDDDLASAAATGDGAAFRLLLDRHYDRVFRIVFCLLRDQAEAEDVTQEIWTSMPRKLRGWRGEARFTTWLHSISVNAARDAGRRAASRGRVAEGFAEVEDLSRGADRDRNARLRWLHAALAELPEDLRETASLILDDDMTQALAAERLGVAEGTVAWRMSEIRKRLRALAAGGEEEAFA